MPGSLFVKRRCTLSNELMSFSRNGDQTGELYSNSGLTYVIKALIKVAESRDTKHFRIKLDRAKALRVIFPICNENFKLLSMVTPRSTTEATLGSVSLLIE